VNRRKVLKLAAGSAIGVMTLGVAYPILEARWCRVARATIAVPRLPAPFVGTTIAFLSDTHHGPYVSLDHVRQAVDLANALEPDIVALGGDYVSKDRKYIAPGVGALGALHAPLGRFGVLGNHDVWEGSGETSEALAKAGIREVTNTGVWVERDGARLRLAGVGDLWTDSQDLNAALGDATPHDATILLSHNPDFAERVHDPRVSLILSGHTHGGQVVVPWWGAPYVPSAFGQKYLHGIVQGPSCPVFVSRGIGTTGPPVRFRCPPEVVFLTLTSRS
jgi:predicted MPP superfamily phosphohydrolase